MKKLLLVLTVVLLASGCRMMGVRGNGNIVTEEREISAFEILDVGGAFNVEIVSGKSPYLKIQAEENLIPLIRTEIKGDKLVISSRKNLNPRKELKIYIEVPDLKVADVSGASRVNAENVSTGKFAVYASGASHVTITGKTDKLLVEASGASHINTYEFTADEVKADVSGASSVKVFAKNSIVSEASGASHISYKGDPQKVITDVSGASSVSRK